MTTRKDDNDGGDKSDDEDSEKSFKRKMKVLQDFSLTLQPGKILALAGPSGSGKSTIAIFYNDFTILKEAK